MVNLLFWPGGLGDALLAADSRFSGAMVQLIA